MARFSKFEHISAFLRADPLERNKISEIRDDINALIADLEYICKRTMRQFKESPELEELNNEIEVAYKLTKGTSRTKSVLKRRSDRFSEEIERNNLLLSESKLQKTIKDALGVCKIRTFDFDDEFKDIRDQIHKGQLIKHTESQRFLIEKVNNVNLVNEINIRECLAFIKSSYLFEYFKLRKTPLDQIEVTLDHFMKEMESASSNKITEIHKVAFNEFALLSFLYIRSRYKDKDFVKNAFPELYNLIWSNEDSATSSFLQEFEFLKNQLNSNSQVFKKSGRKSKAGTIRTKYLTHNGSNSFFSFHMAKNKGFGYNYKSAIRQSWKKMVKTFPEICDKDTSNEFETMISSPETYI